jgi:hypothetical protein
MSSPPRTHAGPVARLARLIDDLGIALGFPAGSRWGWLVFAAAVAGPFVAVVVFGGDEPLISPFVYRS